MIDRQSYGTASWLVPLILSVSVLMLFRAAVFDVNIVNGTSMCPSLYDGDVLLVLRSGSRNVSRGDMVTVWDKDRGEWLIKRVVGLPGETVSMDGYGYVYADGKLIEPEWQMPCVGTFPLVTEITLADDGYYILGDNRYDSYDSRYFGAVSADAIRGRVVFRFWPVTVY